MTTQERVLKLVEDLLTHFSLGRIAICWLSPLAFFACKPQPQMDARLFRPVDHATRDLEIYADTAATMTAIQALPGDARRVDSLLLFSDLLKGFDPAISRHYAERAYDMATDNNWDLQRAISLYYIALTKRLIQRLGGGIEDALVDAEFSGLLFERLGRKDWLVRVYDLMGSIHYRQVEVDRPLKRDTARAYLQRAMKTLETAGLTENDSIMLLAEILHDFGTTYETEAVETARKFYEESYDYYARIDNQIGLLRIRLALAYLLLQEKQFKQTDSLYRICEEAALARKDYNLLSQIYFRQSESLLEKYRQNRDPKLFEKMIDVLEKRISIQKEDKYHSYQQIGLSYQSKAVTMAIRYFSFDQQTQADSANFYLDQHYMYGDSALGYYKTAMDEASNQGVFSEMDNLSFNIFTICQEKAKENRGSCEDIFGTDAATYISKRYKKVADLSTLNLTQANQRIREMERLESERQSTRERRDTLLIGFGILLIAALLFLLFLQRAEQRKLRARMEALRAQINPHFFANSLNAIENLVNLGENKAAAKYLIHFSRLSRRLLSGSREPQTSLQEELQTLQHYLKLEQLRFRDKLEYRIDVAEDLEPDRIEVPAMILQPYVENAILHGIKPKKDTGKLDIVIKRQGKKLVCSLEDNGIGREKAREIKAGAVSVEKSYGMKISEERVTANRRFKGTQVEIIDLKDQNGNALGTRVILSLPFELRK